MGKWRSCIQWFVLALLFVGAILNLWVTFERKEHNRRYGRTIERYEQEVNSLTDLNRDIRGLIGRGKEKYGVKLAPK